MPESRRKPPIWLQRLGQVRDELDFRSDVRDTFRETLALAELGWRQLLSVLRQEQPHLAEEELLEKAYLTVSESQRLRCKLRFGCHS